jgi:hypothetical protein
MVEQYAENINWTEESLIMRTIARMSDARASEKINAYYDYFEDAYQMTLNYLPIESQTKLERDARLCYKTLKELESEANITSRVELMKRVKKDFADTHKFFIFKGLAYRGTQKIESDAEMNFEEKDFDLWTRIVRDNTGLKGAIEGATTTKTDEANGK